MKEKLKGYIKKYGAVLFFILATIIIFRDAGQFSQLIFNLGMIVFVLVGVILLLDDRIGWGIFPYISIEELYQEVVKKKNVAAAITLLAFLLFLYGIVRLGMPTGLSIDR